MFLHTTSSLFRVASRRSLSSGFISQTRVCKTAEEVEAIGKEVSKNCQPGDVLLLWGDVGVGKTCFARGFIRAMLKDESLFVTSPSYLLDNSYQTPDNIILHHMDLHRLPKLFDSTILGIPDVFKTNICLIEWPDRLDSSLLSLNRTISIRILILPNEHREINVSSKSSTSST